MHRPRIFNRPTPEALEAAAFFTAETGFYASAKGKRVVVIFSIAAAQHIAALIGQDAETEALHERLQAEDDLPTREQWDPARYGTGTE